ncbi:MAG TPA: TolC family protein [Burkholderiales bacterium]|nr:TolC family protein [Burkholderiales bacterium]
MQSVSTCARAPWRTLLLFIPTLAAACAFAQAADLWPLAFQEALQVAEQRSARLTAQEAAVGAVGEQVARARELPDPKLRLGLDNVPVSNPDAFSLTRDFMTMRRIGYMQDVPNADKRRARGERAEREQSVEAATLAAQRTQVRQDTALAWLELYYAERSLQAVTRLQEALRLEAETTGPAVAGGRMSPANAVGARAAAETVQDRILEQQRAVARARAAFSALVGEAADRPLGPPPNIETLAHAPHTLVADIDAHPDQRVFAQREALAESEVALAASARKSDWSWEVSFGQREPRFSNMVSVMVTMDLPFWRAQRQDRDVAARVKQLEQARAMREDARRMHEAEVRMLVADWSYAGQRVAQFEKKVLPLTRERSALALAAYRGGRGELASVLEARRAETEVELSRLSAELERARAWARLNYLFDHEVKP